MAYITLIIVNLFYNNVMKRANSPISRTTEEPFCNGNRYQRPATSRNMQKLIDAV